MKILSLFLLTLISTSVMAGGFSNTAALTGIDVVSLGTSGFMIYGDFGNPAGCTVSNAVFIKATHPQYKELYALALSVFNSGNRVIAYAGTCEPVLWYSTSATTYNVVIDGQSLYLRN